MAPTDAHITFHEFLGHANDLIDTRRRISDDHHLTERGAFITNDDHVADNHDHVADNHDHVADNHDHDATVVNAEFPHGHVG